MAKYLSLIFIAWAPCSGYKQNFPKGENKNEKVQKAYSRSLHAAHQRSFDGNIHLRMVLHAMYGNGDTLGAVTTEAGKWYTANNENIDNATNAITNAREVTGKELSGYVIEYNVWLTLAKGSTPVNKAITVTFKRGTTVDASISAVVKVGETNAMVFDHTKVATGETHPTEDTSAAVALSDSAAVKVTVYIYVDGNSENVNTAYLNGGQSITGAIELLFTVKD